MLLIFLRDLYFGESSKPLVRLLVSLVVIAGVLAGLGLLLGPLGLGVTSATGITALGVRQLSKRRAN